MPKTKERPTVAAPVKTANGASGANGPTVAVPVARPTASGGGAGLVFLRAQTQHTPNDENMGPLIVSNLMQI